MVQENLFLTAASAGSISPLPSSIEEGSPSAQTPVTPQPAPLFLLSSFEIARNRLIQAGIYLEVVEILLKSSKSTNSTYFLILALCTKFECESLFPACQRCSLFPTVKSGQRPSLPKFESTHFSLICSNRLKMGRRTFSTMVNKSNLQDCSV